MTQQSSIDATSGRGEPELVCRAGAPGRSIDITPAMIEAGVYAAKECCLGEGLETLVSRIFLAMRTEELDAE